MLTHDHTVPLILASFAIAVMSGFTGLSLTQGASAMSVGRRKLVVTMAAFALGSGIWSMHFVAMLGMKMGVEFYYDALTTLISALVAILLTGVALLLVHFGERTPLRITLAGVCLAAGIVAMHYIGMSGIQAVRPVYTTAGLVMAGVSALLLCIAAFRISYGGRDKRNILTGTVAFGIAVFAVHFIAMAGTHFVAIDGAVDSGLWLSNEMLAFGLTVLSFVICGAFLLVSVTFIGPAVPSKPAAEPVPVIQSEEPPHIVGKLPFEKDGRINFVSDTVVSAVRAEGHYTFLYHPSGRLFCPWSISQVAERDTGKNFVRCHRSYLINPKYITGFERKKDNGVCYFEGDASITQVPVSRSYLKQVRDTLGV